jgi:hypothetical protein
VGQFLAIMTGHMVSGASQGITFNTYYEANNTPVANPSATLLTASGTLPSSQTSSAVSLVSSYALEEVITIQASSTEATYSLDASVGAVPEPTTMIAGAMLLIPFGLQGIRCLRSRKQMA